jgi:hypothetical protein
MNLELEKIRVNARSLLRAADLIAVAAVVIFLIFEMDPRDIFTSSIPTGGDYGGHYQVPWYMAHYLLPHFQITGWSPDWYDGWPFLIFYFPTPPLMIALLGFILPYNVAFKIFMLIGMICLPICIYVFGRALKAPGPVPALMSAASLCFLFNSSYTIDGGNIVSTMAGEYSYEIGLCFAFLFLAAFYSSLLIGRKRLISAVLFGLTVSSHILTGVFAAFGALILYLISKGDYRQKILQLKNSAVIFISGIFLISFWLVPLIIYRGYMADMGYYKVTPYYKNLIPDSIEWAIVLAAAGSISGLIYRKRYEIASVLLLISGIASFLEPRAVYVSLLVLSFAASITMPRSRPIGFFLAIIGCLSFVQFRYTPNGFVLYNAWGLPTWFLAIYLSAGLAIGDFCALLTKAFRFFYERRKLSARKFSFSLSVFDLFSKYIFTALVILLLAVAVGGKPIALAKHISPAIAPSWVKFNLSGYQEKIDYKEYQAIMSMLNNAGRKYGCGRVFWEYSNYLNGFGTTMALMLIPQFTNECIDTEEGLFFESSATSPYHFLDQSELSLAPDYAMSNLPYNYSGPDISMGVGHLQMFGIKYYLAMSSQIESMADANPDLTLIDETGPWQMTYSGQSETVTWDLYEVTNASIVSPLQYVPNIINKLPQSKFVNLSNWTVAALPWFLNSEQWPVVLVDKGPPTWPRTQYRTIPANELTSFHASNITWELTYKKVKPTTVSDIEMGTESLSFNVSTTGKPVLVKISYFPNWKATGALGPYRASPNLMVVVPTSHHVVLTFSRTGVNYVADALTLIGVLALVYLGLGHYNGYSVALEPIIADGTEDPKRDENYKEYELNMK